MKRIFTTLLVLAPILTLTTAALAVNVAVIDSGTDYKHEVLKDKMWTNPGEAFDDGVDHDNNGKTNDFYGWNFAEKNRFVIDYKYQGTFSKDPYKYFEIQLKRFNGTATEEEIAWAKAKVQDANFMKEMQIFGNYVHGTHVAGISARDSALGKIMALKIMPTEVKVPGGKLAAELAKQLDGKEGGPALDKVKDLLIRQLLTQLATAQGKNLEAVGLYVRLKEAKVANCSFGTSAHAVKPLFAQLLKAIMQRDLTEEELTMYTKFFMQQVVDNGKQWMIYGKETFFVIAAGNDGSNNDELPTYPANVKRDNAITVAATFGRSKIASFSNYGTQNVEVAAPGVGILSSIPGNEYLTVSGTSQAAPYVTNTVSRMFETNAKLTFKEVRAILMGTVDKKDFLTDKVASGGIVNVDRAVYGAKLALSRSIDDAIATARKEVADLGDTQIEGDGGIFLPFPSMIQ